MVIFHCSWGLLLAVTSGDARYAEGAVIGKKLALSATWYATAVHYVSAIASCCLFMVFTSLSLASCKK